MPDLSEVVEKKTKQKTAVPKNWKVIFVNDDRTPMEFVIAVLQSIFYHKPETATKLMLQVHEQGSAVVGTYSYEIAESKSIETTELARANGYPLAVRLEEE